MTRFLPLVLAGASVAGVLSAQALPQHSTSDFLIPIHTADAAEGVPYGTWASGDTYKVSFHDGMTFVPYLGADYPQNQPLSWRTVSVTAGGQQLLTEGARPVRWQDGGFRYEYRFGAVTEAYDVLAEGLEQTFTVHRRPAAGDLVVTGVVDTQLTSTAIGAAHQALTFGDAANRPIVGYGEAFALDAAGDRIAITTSCEDGAIRLTVPGAWLANATFPVTIDPLLTRVSVSNDPAVVRWVDISCDMELFVPRFMFVYVRAASQYDDDVGAFLTNFDYTGSTTVYSDITTSWDSDGARCAYVAGANSWLMVFRRYYANNPLRLSRLYAHTHARSSTAFSTTLALLASPTGHNDWRCDVGGAGFGTQALVVFQRENNGISPYVGHWAQTATSEVRGAVVDVSGVYATWGAPFLITGNANVDVERPSVNKEAVGGTNSQWVVATQVYDQLLGWTVDMRRVASGGPLGATGTQMFPLMSGLDHAFGPVVEGRDGRYAVLATATDIATTPAKTGSVLGKQVWIQRFDWASGTSSPTLLPAVMLANAQDKRYEARGLGYDMDYRSHFGLSFAESGPGARDLHYRRVGYSGNVTEAGTLYPATTGLVYGGDCVFDNDSARFLFAYGYTTQVYGQTLEYTAAPPVSTVGSGCSSATIHWSGSRQIGSEFERVYVTGSSAAAGHFMMVSLVRANLSIVHPAVALGCRLLVDNQTGFLAVLGFQVASQPSWNFALPERVPPLTLYFQDWILDGGVLRSTQRLEVPIVK